MTKNASGWRGIGRSLVIATTGSDSIAQMLHDRNVVVIQLDGTPVELARRRALAPDLVDAVVLDATGEDREDVLELGRVLRGRFVSVVFILPNDRWGKRNLRTYLGVFRYQDRVVLPELWMAVSVAAQQTWTLGWLRVDKRRDEDVSWQTESDRRVVIRVKDAGRVKDGLQTQNIPNDAARVEAPLSRTRPWMPSASLLVELTEAYREKR